MTYTHNVNRLQEPDCEYEQTPELAAILDRHWLTKAEREVDQDRNLICASFLLNHTSLNDFVKMLSEHGVRGSTEYFWRAYATGVLALAAEAHNAAVALPEPPVDAVRERNKAEGKAA